MNLNYLIGNSINRVRQAGLSSRSFPLTRLVPYGRYLLYDVQRFLGTRDLDVIFDVGANQGQSAWGFVRYFPSALIYCFEPEQSAYELTCPLEIGPI